MDFCHLIVTCLFSMLRLPFDNQKVKGNYAIFSKNTKAFLQHSRTYDGIGLHVYTRKLTRIYASDYTDVRISLRVYMSEVSGSAILTFILCTEMYLVVQICTLCHKR